MPVPLYKPRPERWPQFSLRTFLVLVTLLGSFLGWTSVQAKWIRDRREERLWVQEYGFTLNFSEGFRHPNGQLAHVSAPWSIRLFEPGVAQISLDCVGAADKEKVALLKQLFPEARIYGSNVGKKYGWKFRGERRITRL